MPYKTKEDRQQHNREARARERTELKTLRVKVSKALELIKTKHPIREVEKVLLEELQH